MGANPPRLCCQQPRGQPKQLPQLQQYNSQHMSASKHSSYVKVEQSAKKFCQKYSISEFYVPLICKIMVYPYQNFVEEKWSHLSQEKRSAFLQSLNDVKFSLMDELFHFFSDDFSMEERIKSKLEFSYAPEVYYDISDKTEKKWFYTEKGLNLVKNHKVALVLMCAGSSSRLQDNVPKFLKSIEVQGQTTVMDCVFANLKRAVGQISDFPIILSCNPQNIKIIQDYLQQKQYYGFSVTNFKFLISSSFIVLNSDGKYCLNQNFELIKRAPGTAECAQLLFSQEMEQFFREEKIEYIYFSGMENFKEKPCDPLLLGHVLSKNKKIGVKCIDSEPISEEKPDKIFPWYYIGLTKDNTSIIELVHSAEIVSFPKKRDRVRFAALNSLVFELNELRKIVYNLQKDLSQPEAYYVQKKEETLLSATGLLQQQLSYGFERDVRSYITFVEDPFLFLVEQKESYCPLLTKDKQFSMQQVQEQFKKAKELNTSLIPSTPQA